MSSTPPHLAEVLQSLAALRGELQQLAARVDSLETKASGGGPRVASPVVDEELLTVISAAVAAFLGERPRIRQIRLLTSPSWAEQGRATIQASHALSPRHN